jgi:hypothetical protein
MTGRKMDTVVVLVVFAVSVVGCSRSPSAPEVSYPDLSGVYQGSVQYGCGIAGLPYSDEMPLAIQVHQDQGRLHGTWTEVIHGLAIERQFNGFIGVGAIQIVFEDHPGMRIRCYFDSVSQARTELAGEGYDVGGADGQCLRFYVFSPVAIDARAADDPTPW